MTALSTGSMQLVTTGAATSTSNVGAGTSLKSIVLTSYQGSGFARGQMLVVLDLTRSELSDHFVVKEMLIPNTLSNNHVSQRNCRVEVPVESTADLQFGILDLAVDAARGAYYQVTDPITSESLRCWRPFSLASFEMREEDQIYISLLLDISMHNRLSAQTKRDKYNSNTDMRIPTLRGGSRNRDLGNTVIRSTKQPAGPVRKPALFTIPRQPRRAA